jgi:hypothetical protein
MNIEVAEVQVGTERVSVAEGLIPAVAAETIAEVGSVITGVAVVVEETTEPAVAVVITEITEILKNDID